MIVVKTDRPRITSQKSQFIIVQALKKYKKGYIEITEKIYLETFEKCPGPVCFPLLPSSTSLFLFQFLLSIKCWGP